MRIRIQLYKLCKKIEITGTIEECAVVENFFFTKVKNHAAGPNLTNDNYYGTNFLLRLIFLFLYIFSLPDPDWQIECESR